MASGSSLTRRGFGGLLGAAAGTGALSPTWASANADQETEHQPSDRGRPSRKPNLLVILGDDLGWADLSSYGAPDIRTPNLDKLALSGIRFTQAYSASAVCSPTRFGLYTGRYPGRLPGGTKEPIGAPNEIDGIPLDHPTLATLLKGRGYDTAMFGKWHCGYLPWFSPTRLGWDEFFGNFSGGLDYFSKINHNGDHDLFEDEVEVEDLRYYTEIVTEKAVGFIHRKHDAPWLLNLNFTTPHWPWEGPGDRAVSDELTAADRGRRAAGPVPQRRRLAAEVRRDGGGPGPVDRQGPQGARPHRPASGHPDLLRERQRRRAVLAHVAAVERQGRHPRGRDPGAHHPQLAGRSCRPARSATRRSSRWTGRRPSWSSPGPSPTRRTPSTAPAWSATCSAAGRRRSRDLFWRMRSNGALRRGNLKYYRTSAGVERLHDLATDTLEKADVSRHHPDELAALRAAWQAIDAELVPYT